MNYDNLKATIAANIYQNASQEVSANMVKTAIDAAVDSLGAGYQYLGVATPATNPGSPDYKCFYIATAPGTYPNFSMAELKSGAIGFFVWDSSWTIKIVDSLSQEIAQQIMHLSLNKTTSALTYSGRAGLAISDGAVEMRLRWPSDMSYNQLLFSWGNQFMVSLNSDKFLIYNSSAFLNSASFTAFRGKVVTLRIVKSTVSGTSKQILVLVDGVQITGIVYTESATDSTDLAIGSYAGSALRSEIDFYYLAKYDPAGQLEYVITPSTPATTKNDVKLFAGDTELANSILKPNLDALPDTLYVTASKEFNIYMENVVIGFKDGMTICVDGVGVNKIEAMDRCVRINIGTTGTYSTTWSLYDANGGLVESKTVVIKVAAATAGSGKKNFLFVGDSTIDNAVPGVYEHEGPEIVREFHTLCVNNRGFAPYLLGKRSYPENESGGYRHEGHAGQSSSFFIGSSSPFYYNGALDFASYVADVLPLTPGTTGGIDFMIYQIGLNDLKTGGSPASVIANIKTLITALFASYPNAKVIIGMPPTGCDATGWAAHFNGGVTTLSGYMAFRNRMLEYLREIISEFDNGAYNANVFICNGGEMIDRVYGFPYEELPVSSRVSTAIMTHTDSMHPNKDGYDQIADGYFGRVKNLV